MPRLLNRLFKIAQAETGAALSRLEDPVKLSEQGVRDLRRSLADATISLTQVKSVAIRMRREAEDETRRADAYEQKAVLLLSHAKEGKLAATEADRLAAEMLRLKRVADERRRTLEADAARQEQLAAQLQGRVEQLKLEVNRYERDLVTLQARATTARSAKTISQHLAKADGSSTAAMLGRMREKVAAEEALAEAYEQLHGAQGSAEREVERALSQTGAEAAAALADLKARLDAAAQPPIKTPTKRGAAKSTAGVKQRSK